MKLYRPVLIESAEQAEALDWKTPIQIVLNRTQEVHDVKLIEDFAEDFWSDALEPGNRWVYVALVPVEAEEQFGAREPRWGQVWTSTYPRADRYEAEGEIQRSSQYGDPSHLVHRLVTPWEEAHGIH